MKELIVSAKNLATAYHMSLLKLNMYGEETKCSDWETECKECSMTIQVEEPLREPMISKCTICGDKELQQYVMEMLDGILDFEVDRGKWKYTYHKRMVDFGGKDQIKYVIDELKRNPNSRRAVITIRNPEDVYSNEPACLQMLQYFIRNNKLECVAIFRSNDACKAAFMNMFALIMLQKRIADELGIGVGKYTHKANSYHVYKKDYDLLKGYTKRIFNDEDSCLMNYVDEAKDDMDSYIPTIKELVETLKTRK